MKTTIKPTRNQFELSQIIVERSLEIAKGYESDEECEKERFFYWIMSQMAIEVEGNNNKGTYCLKLATARRGSRIKVYHPYKNPLADEYVVYTQLSEKEFRGVMKYVAKLINSLPQYEASYNYNHDFRTAYLDIFLRTSCR